MAALPRYIIPDANTLFSFFNVNSVRRHVFRELLKKDVKFFAPEFVIEEILSEKDRIKESSGVNESEFSYLFTLLNKQINKSTKGKLEEFLTEAVELAPHEKDASYFALALSLNCQIWSDEKAFKKQSKVEVFSTKELLELLSKTEEI